MISTEKYKEILDKGLMADHYLVLEKINKGQSLPSNQRVKGIINLLIKKGYMIDGAITDIGLSLLDGEATELSVCTTTTMNIKVIDFNLWVAGLHKRCQDRIFELTGSRQARAKIKMNNKFIGKGYPFLPNIIDMAKKLISAVEKYKLKDYDKIEKAIINHIDRCNMNNDWFPLMKYYIMKDGESQMVTEMDEEDSPTDTFISPQKHV